MSSTFPHARKSRLGYDVDEVEDFLEDARRAYTAEPGRSGLSAERIRHTAFKLRKGGYSPEHVDAALERLEDAFATREREAAVARTGDEAWYAEARARAQEVLDRLVRAHGHRFRRTGPFAVGYSTTDVDALADRVSAFFQKGQPITPEEIRSAAFRSQRGGYSEQQVDVVFDAVIDVMLAVR